MGWLRSDNETIRWARVGTVALIGVLTVGTLVPLVKSGLRVHKDLVQVQKNPTEENKRELDASLEVSKALVGGIGTIATIFGGVILYLNFHTAQEKQVTERFARAIEHLGNSDIHIRLGGIYALERIARDSVKDHWTIMEILSAYVREKSPLEVFTHDMSQDFIASARKSLIESVLEAQRETLPIGNECGSEEKVEGDQKKEARKTKGKRLSVDVQSALTVVGRRNVGHDPEGTRIDLSYTNLAGANLVNAFLQDANLMGTNLQDANPWGANLRNAFLQDANLQNVSFWFVDLKGAKLWGTNLRNADLIGAKGWTDIQLTGAKRCETRLPKGCKLNPNSHCKEIGIIISEPEAETLGSPSESNLSTDYSPPSSEIRE